MKKIMDFINDEEGAAIPEYALLVALIAAVCIGAITLLGGKAKDTFDEVSKQLPGGGD
jgi:pilus assembly protein Flp/PilA